jgi:hypothetical protein
MRRGVLLIEPISACNDGTETPLIRGFRAVDGMRYFSAPSVTLAV